MYGFEMPLICWQRLAALTQVLQGAMPQTTDVDEAEVDQFPTTDVSCSFCREIHRNFAFPPKKNLISVY